MGKMYKDISNITSTPSLHREIIFGMRAPGLCKSILPPAAAIFYIETTLDSLILLCKINESSVVSNYYLALRAK